MTTAPVKPAVIAHRKACQPTGVGLSHYVLLTNTTPRRNASDNTSAR
jgi:modified peptide precursor CbpA